MYPLELEICPSCLQPCVAVSEKEPEPLDLETVVTPEQLRDRQIEAQKLK